MLFSVRVSAEEAKFPQRIAWTTNANALEYKVEIQNTVTKESEIITTEQTFAELSLPPGAYRYRVTAYDFLGREAETSKWTKFDIIQAGQPTIRSVEKKVPAAKTGQTLEIAVDIANVSSESVVELISETVQGELGSGVKKGSEDETGEISKVYFKDVPPGKWRLRVTNASGLSAESDVIEVEGTVVAETAADKKAREDAEREAERLRREEEKRLEYEARQKERSAEEEMKRKIREAQEEERARLEAEKEEKKAAKKKYREEHPYISKDIAFKIGAGYTLATYDGKIRDWTEKSSALSLRAGISFFPKKTETQRLGFELTGWYTQFKGNAAFGYEISLLYAQVLANVVWQHRLFRDNLFVSCKGGVGLGMVQKDLQYLQYSDYRDQPGVQRFYAPAFDVGVSLYYIPFTFVVAELGLDFTHVALSDAPTGFFTPYICVGFRL